MTRTSALVSILVLAVATGRAALPVHAQDALATGVIMGRVVDADTGRPIDEAGAILRFTTSIGGKLADQKLTESKGYFVFRDVAPGGYTVGGTKDGYESTNLSGRAVPTILQPGGVVNVLVRIRKYSAIGGTVLDEAGEPIVGVNVRLLFHNTRDRWTAGTAAVTDDRGVYRFTKMRAGEYAVFLPSAVTAVSDATMDIDSMSPEARASLTSLGFIGANAGPTALVGNSVVSLNRAARPPTISADGHVFFHATMFAPSAPSLTSARIVVVKGGQSIDHVDIVTRPVQVWSVSGVLTPVAGFSAVRQSLRLRPLDRNAVSDVPVAVTDTAGRFTFVCVPPGKYAVDMYRAPDQATFSPGLQVDTGTEVLSTNVVTSPVARGAVPSGPTFWARTEVTVGAEDVRDLEVPVHTGVRITGRVEYDGTSPRPTASELALMQMQLRYTTNLENEPYLPGRVDASGRLSTPELLPGRYQMFFSSGTWGLRSAIFEGRDIADETIELGDRPMTDLVLTLTDKLPRLSGTVRGATTAMNTPALVIAFTTDQKVWQPSYSRRFASARTSPTGTYELPALPSGEYFVVALEDDSVSDWNDPPMLARLAAVAQRVTLSEGPRAVKDLQSVPMPRAKSAASGALTLDTTETCGASSTVDDDGAPTRVAGATISGTVVDGGAAGTPLRGVAITARRSDGALARSAFTDASGSFTVTGLPSGHYRVIAAKAAYLKTEYGATRPGRPGVSVALSDGQSQTLRMTLTRGAVVSGVVVDGTGRPLTAMAVKVLSPRTTSDGRETLVVPPGATPAEAETDDLGRFRIYGLPSGEYVVNAYAGIGSSAVLGRPTAEAELTFARGRGAGANGRPAQIPVERVRSYVSTYFADASRASDGRTVRLSASEQRDDLKITMRLGTISQLSGTVLSPSGAPAAASRVVFFPSRAYASVAVSSSTGDVFSRGGSVEVSTTAEGTFAIRGLTPGAYTMFVRGADTAGKPLTLWTVVPVTMPDQDVTDFRVTLQPGLSLRGGVTFDGTAPAPDLTRIRVVASTIGRGAISMTTPPAAVEVTQQFSIGGLIQSAYGFALTGLPAPWVLKAALVDGKDILDTGADPQPAASTDITLVVTDHPSAIAGTFSDASGHPMSDYYVVVFPSDRQYWRQDSRRIRAMRPATDGAFLFENLPPGEYRLAAVTDVENNEWFDSRFLEQLTSTSVPISLADGEHKRQDVKIGGR